MTFSWLPLGSTSWWLLSTTKACWSCVSNTQFATCRIPWSFEDVLVMRGIVILSLSKENSGHDLIIDQSSWGRFDGCSSSELSWWWDLVGKSNDSRIRPFLWSPWTPYLADWVVSSELFCQHFPKCSAYDSTSSSWLSWRCKISPWAALRFLRSLSRLLCCEPV